MNNKKSINNDDSQESSSEEEESLDDQILVNNGAIQNFIPGSINPIDNLLQFQAIPNYYVPYFCTFTNNNSYFQPTTYNPYSYLQNPYYYNPYLQYLPLYSQPILNDPMMCLNSPFYFSNINTSYMIQPQQIPNPILTKSTSRKYHKKSQQKKKTKKSKSPKDKTSTSNTATSSNSIIKQETPIENKIKQETQIENKIRQETPIENKIRQETQIENKIRQETQIENKIRQETQIGYKIKPYCTFAASGRKSIEQALYECQTCKREGRVSSFEGICEVCARTCHQGHDIHPKIMSLGNYCCCPLKCNCQSNPFNPDLTCTKKSTGGNRISQPMYLCLTCSNRSSYKYICQNCAVREHHGHSLIYKGIIHNESCQNDDLNSQKTFGSSANEATGLALKVPFAFEPPPKNEPPSLQWGNSFDEPKFQYPSIITTINPWAGK